MRRTMILLSLATLLIGTAVYSARRLGPNASPLPTAPTPTAKDPDPRPAVDIVIALDTSGSMSGLINAARQKLWDIVNEVAEGQTAPRLRVGLVTFGSGGTEGDGYVVIQSDLTTNLDAIYGKLFELTTSGGTEYVGRAIHRSLAEMSWTTEDWTLRQIYVAGNESADQDRRVPVATALAAAREQGVFVNAIYCGSDSGHDATSWRVVARQGEGMYAAIDHNNGTVALRSPYDDELNRLSGALNSTYVAYGPGGAAGSAAQEEQDSNAARTHSSTAAARAVAKASSVYDNSGWDLVDAVKAGGLKAVPPPQALPAELRDKSASEVQAYVQGKERERAQIRAKIGTLAKKRKAYVASEMKRQGKSAEGAFDTAVKRALHEQAAKKNIKLK